jgi:ribose 5-phosphate isomerase A
VEIVPFGWKQTLSELERLSLHPVLRRISGNDADPPFITDGGHYIVDCHSGEIAEPPDLALAIKAVSGVVDHGLFIAMATRAVVIDTSGDIREIGRAPSPMSTPDRPVLGMANQG